MVKDAAKKAPAKKAPAKKAPAKAGSATAATTMTLRQIAASLAETHEITKKQSETILNDAFDMMTKNLKKGVRIRISGFGILSVRKRAARMGRNPATGEAIKIKASKKVGFRPAKELKEAI